MIRFFSKKVPYDSQISQSKQGKNTWFLGDLECSIRSVHNGYQTLLIFHHGPHSLIAQNAFENPMNMHLLTFTVNK